MAGGSSFRLSDPIGPESGSLSSLLRGVYRGRLFFLPVAYVAFRV